jgi:(4-O-methyl)-D-glucuronate---lignin esterase
MPQWTHPWTAAAAATLALAGADLAAQQTAARAPSVAATTPEPRGDANSELAHAQLVHKAGAGVIDVYFIGDSITRRWGALDYPDLLANFRKSFFGWNAANFGWGGDRTQNILWRLDNGELAGVAPKVFVVQAGTNNLGDYESAEAREEAIAGGIEAIVERCRRHAPDALVVLTAVFPRRDRPEWNASIAAINARLAVHADDEHVVYLDINHRLVDSRGLLTEAMSEDGLHPSLAAYRIWADALRPVLAARLGAPAEVDRAPPPTGNPAAR